MALGALMPTRADFVAAAERATGRPGRRRGRETLLLCRAHDDPEPSLNVREGDDAVSCDEWFRRLPTRVGSAADASRRKDRRR
jgi:hypothetical protein